jgi:4-hydroxybenzoate polyprenyltransferase
VPGDECLNREWFQAVREARVLSAEDCRIDAYLSLAINHEAWVWSPDFLSSLSATVAYSKVWKGIWLIDVITLSAFYTIRIFAGAAAAGIGL